MPALPITVSVLASNGRDAEQDIHRTAVFPLPNRLKLMDSSASRKGVLNLREFVYAAWGNDH